MTLANLNQVFSALNSDAVEECKINCDMMRRVVAAVNILSPALKAFIYPGGTRVCDPSAPELLFLQY
jgi:hypothetical protein